MLSGAKIISACPVEPSKIPSDRSNAAISTLRIIIEDFLHGKAVYHSGLFKGLALGCRAGDTAHAAFHQRAYSDRVFFDDIADQLI